MKLIGAEIRIGVRGVGHEMKREIKLIPLEIVFPDILASYYVQPIAEVTFHTSHGDVTAYVTLPLGSYDSSKQVSQDEVRKIMDKFAASLES